MKKNSHPTYLVKVHILSFYFCFIRRLGNIEFCLCRVFEYLSSDELNQIAWKCMPYDVLTGGRGRATDFLLLLSVNQIIIITNNTA